MYTLVLNTEQESSKLKMCGTSCENGEWQLKKLSKQRREKKKQKLSKVGQKWRVKKERIAHIGRCVRGTQSRCGRCSSAKRRHPNSNHETKRQDNKSADGFQR